jgi:hypothetical protein
MWPGGLLSVLFRNTKTSNAIVLILMKHDTKNIFSRHIQKYKKIVYNKYPPYPRYLFSNNNLNILEHRL